MTNRSKVNADAMGEQYSAPRASKKHTNFTSAFAINEHAELCLDLFNGDAVGRIEEVRYATYGIVYNVAMSVNVGTDSDPVWGWHSGRPISGVNSILLRKIESDLPNDLKGKFPELPSTEFQVGDVVCFSAEGICENKTSHSIPVLIWGVSYEEGKVMYDVSIDADEYKDTSAYNTIYERYLKHSMDKVDSIFVTKPMPRLKASVTIDADNGVTVAASGDVTFTVQGIDINHNC